MNRQTPEIISAWTILDLSTDTRVAPSTSHLEISNVDGNNGEMVLDYGRCEGGTPIFVVENAASSEGANVVPFSVVYSETRNGVDQDTGQSPSFPLYAGLTSDTCCGRRWSILPVLERDGHLQE